MAVLLVTGSLGSVAHGQDAKRAAKSKKTAASSENASSSENAVSPKNAGSRAKRLPGVTAEREAAALTFVKQHHAELLRLLRYLRESQPRQYQRAIRELARTAERLGQYHERDMDRYELELQAWKVRSRIDLMSALWQTEPSDVLRDKLRAALAEQLRLRKLFLQNDRSRLLERVEKLDLQIEQLNDRQKQELESRLRALTSPRKDESTRARGVKNRSPTKAGQANPRKNKTPDQDP